MAPNLMLEIKMVRNFVELQSQEIFIRHLSSIKTRHLFLEQLSDFRHLSWQNFARIKEHEENLIAERLLIAGISSTKCYVISEDPETDTETLEMTQAIHQTKNKKLSAILIFGNAEVICFMDANTNSSFISNAVPDSLR